MMLSGSRCEKSASFACRRYSSYSASAANSRLLCVAAFAVAVAVDEDDDADDDAGEATAPAGGGSGDDVVVTVTVCVTEIVAPLGNAADFSTTTLVTGALATAGDGEADNDDGDVDNDGADDVIADGDASCDCGTRCLSVEKATVSVCDEPRSPAVPYRRALLPSEFKKKETT